ncbi:hypothetical protein BT93_K2245 [Corymbia citriodora subsp. variegata]|nr:hypothetical protein BT93_K2245 [Corymbia citriodora subsp. variegata]
MIQLNDERHDSTLLRLLTSKIDKIRHGLMGRGRGRSETRKLVPVLREVPRLAEHPKIHLPIGKRRAREKIPQESRPLAFLHHQLLDLPGYPGFDSSLLPLAKCSFGLLSECREHRQNLPVSLDSGFCLEKHGKESQAFMRLVCVFIGSPPCKCRAKFLL